MAEISVGAILEGSIKSITKFGAFVTLPGGRSGLVHISEIAHTYVAEVRDFLTEGQEVKVKVVGIDDAGRINLSIKKATPPPPRPQNGPRERQGGGRPDFRSRGNGGNGGGNGGDRPHGPRPSGRGGWRGQPAQPQEAGPSAPPRQKYNPANHKRPGCRQSAYIFCSHTRRWAAGSL